MSSSFSRADVARIATLARLDITEAELDLYARQLGDILDYARRIQDVNTEGVSPDSPSVAADALRPDDAMASLPVGEALRNAPQGDAVSGTFVVPKVIG
jgi:aspartyl-tRNA(Asn)/glutamyl-tRNA(Gln) amidotransferase subunit C